MRSYTDSWSPSIAVVIWRILALRYGRSLVYGRCRDRRIHPGLRLSDPSVSPMAVSLPSWTTLVDQLLCISIIPFWPEAGFGLALPLFETMLAGTPLFSLPILAVLVIGYVDPDLPLLLMLVQASFAGWIVLCWSKQTHQYRLEADQERRDRYELEILKGESLWPMCKRLSLQSSESVIESPRSRTMRSAMN